MSLVKDREPNDRDKANTTQKIDYSYKHMTIDELLDERNTLKKLSSNTALIDKELYGRTFR